MTGDPRNSFPLHATLQFAPNFSVYVLPPDVVCLYSEDRKFFLHGELFCALTSAIGEGGRSVRELVGELERNFPSAAIHEALKRLIDRRYVLPASRASAGVIPAYWASLGLPPETADRNLQNCRVRIRSIDVDGATELDAALRELGVRIVTRSPDLTVTLVGDYLDGRLEELNRQHLSDLTPWILAQPSGIFPLVGPVFLPGKSACWTCVADRMRRNREVKALLDRQQVRCIAVSPLARYAVGQSGIQLAAIEIAKAIAADFRTELRDHIISLDLLGSSTVKHYVARRPQYPSCGRKKLRDPRRAPLPLKLSAGGKLVMTSGGYRAVAPRRHGCTFPQAREPPHRRGLTPRTDRSRPMERDAYAIWWYNRLQRPAVDLGQMDDPYVRDLQARLAETGRRLWVLDVTSDLGVPSFVTILHWIQDAKENIEFGSGAHFDSRVALLRALTELNQFLSIGLMGGGTGEKPSLDGSTPLRLQDHPFLMPSKGPAGQPAFSAKFGRLDAHEQVTACVRLAEREGLDFLVLNQTRPDIDVPVVRVIVPGLRHFYRRFAPGRLYDVPVKLGLRDRPLSEDELNAAHPHT